MSIEAIQELETLASVCPELNMANYTEDDVRRLNDWAIEMSLLVEKFAAIQQAEAKTYEPVAVRNPFASRCYTMSESHLSGHRLIVGFEKLEDSQSAHEWVARCGRSNPGEPPAMWYESDLIGGETDCEPSRPPRTAPGVPDDAARYALLRERFNKQKMSACQRIVEDLGLDGDPLDGLDFLVDKDRFNATQAQKGQG